MKNRFAYGTKVVHSINRLLEPPVVCFGHIVTDSESQTRRGFPAWERILLAIAALYFLIAYLILPRLWKRHERHLGVMKKSPRVTQTSSDIPGDPLNIALVGTEEDSNLYLFGRKEDLAFEKPVGGSPKERHHVRFWHMEKSYDDRPAWIGSAAYDIGVELSRTTGQVTHHISPNIDAERDLLVADVSKAVPAQVQWLDSFHQELRGRNGGGDPWQTDGRLAIVVLPLMQTASSPIPKETEKLP